jgi:hypothetical protein
MGGKNFYHVIISNLKTSCVLDNIDAKERYIFWDFTPKSYYYLRIINPAFYVDLLKISKLQKKMY